MTKFSFSSNLQFLVLISFGQASGRYWNNFLNYLWRNFPVGALVINQLALSTFRRCLILCTLAAHAPWYILLYVWVLFPLISQVLLMLVCGKTPDKVDESKKVLILVSTRTFVFEIEMVSLKIRFQVYTIKKI